MLENNFTDLEEILKTDIDFLEKIKAISETIKSVVKADRCTIFIHDPKTHSFWSAYVEGVSYIELPDTSGIVHEIFEKNQPEIINSVQNSKEYNMTVEENTGYIIHSMIAAPIIDESQKPIGVIQVINKMAPPHQFSADDQDTLSNLLHHINQYTKSLKGI
ncbi:MAG: GAF domain-containing protein [gamma proteobacterium symbiont of Taylorina sp.]|nr:GAF domain-containing protein [gamma proteobacterium symbiont of Taylorina sp.]